MDFKFIEDKSLGRWVISAPKRANRPSTTKGSEIPCPFCIGQEVENEELYRIPENSDTWKVRVIKNKFHFAPIHEIIIHSPDHHKSFDELPIQLSELILKTYRERFNANLSNGVVCIFNNHGEAAGESVHHPHSQLVVIPDYVKLELPHSEIQKGDKTKETAHFNIFCPVPSQWPDEVWVYPKIRERYFGQIEDSEITDLAKILYRIIQIMDLRHGHEFPYNFFIYPHKDWYLRLVPRIKIIGAFEVSTGVFVNTQRAEETIDFIIEHFDTPDHEKIRTTHRATYSKHA